MLTTGDLIVVLFKSFVQRENSVSAFFVLGSNVAKQVSGQESGRLGAKRPRNISPSKINASLAQVGCVPTRSKMLFFVAHVFHSAVGLEMASCK